MKKAFYIAVTVLVCALAFVSCKKEYHCVCSFNNQVMYTKDLMNQTKSNAETQCSLNDSTVAGEVWNCTIY